MKNKLANDLLSFVNYNLKNIKWSSFYPKLLAFLILTLVGASVMAQTKILRYKDKDFQLGLFPGIGTNGIHSGWYFNKFSLNIFSGVSAGSRYFELAGISNLSLRYSSGIQIAGLANVVGSNTYINLTLREERELIREEEIMSTFMGFQVAGVVNYVMSDMVGSQITGGFNLSQGSVFGLQTAGLANIAFRHLSGVQIAGLYNIANRSVSGFQISILGNFTKGPLYGTQIGVINKNIKMVGKRSNPPIKAKSLQLGLINLSKSMSGTQIGLINYAKEMGGTQIGLINFFSNAVVTDAQHNGVPIGVLNFGSRGHFTRFSINELFLYNIERSTGNCGNCSRTRYGFPINDRFQKYNQNAITLSYNPSSMRVERPQWAFGLKFERLMYIKYTMAPVKNGPQNKAYFLSWGAGLQHVNWGKEIEPKLSLLTTINATYGHTFRFAYWYVALRLNNYVYENQDSRTINGLVIYQNGSNDIKYSIWPGYSVGIQI